MSIAKQTRVIRCKTPQLDHRGFLAGTAGLTFSIIKPNTVCGTEANTKINLGIVGCGGRGTWIAKLFADHTGYNIVAAAIKAGCHVYLAKPVADDVPGCKTIAESGKEATAKKTLFPGGFPDSS